MEALLDQAEAALKAMDDAKERLDQMGDTFLRLADYYTSPDWRRDFEADEQGRLPKDLKRGVLSEDAVWNVLTRYGAWTEDVQKTE